MKPALCTCSEEPLARRRHAARRAGAAAGSSRDLFLFRRPPVPLNPLSPSEWEETEGGSKAAGRPFCAAAAGRSEGFARLLRQSLRPPLLRSFRPDSAGGGGPSRETTPPPGPCLCEPGKRCAPSSPAPRFLSATTPSPAFGAATGSRSAFSAFASSSRFAKGAGGRGRVSGLGKQRDPPSFFSPPTCFSCGVRSESFTPAGELTGHRSRPGFKSRSLSRHMGVLRGWFVELLKRGCASHAPPPHPPHSHPPFGLLLS